MAPLRTVAAATAALLATGSVVNAIYVNGTSVAPCDSLIYCRGDLLREVELASPFADSKTFVDMPTRKPVEEVLAAFGRLTKPLRNNTELNDFLRDNFAQAGQELEALPASELQTDAAFLARVNDTVVREFAGKVIDIWPHLTRRYAGPATDCPGCTSSFVPVNRTFVVAGGRFREPYYWDSYWILEGLLRTGGAFVDISKNMIENFLDMVETIGFVPNGARVYYLNRSQLPVLSQMVRIYIDHTNDTSILARAVPLLIKEHEFFVRNRSVDVTASDGRTYRLNRYSVGNTEPRPESFREDYTTANNASYWSPSSGIIYPQNGPPLNQTQKAELYAQLATGAETGWDYSARWLTRPADAARDNYFPLRSLNTNNLVPVDLNSVLYANEVAIAGFLARTGDDARAEQWRALAANRSEAMTAVFWNQTLYSYFDYNLTSGAQYTHLPADEDATEAERAGSPAGKMVFFQIAQFYPFWTGAAPAALKNNPLAVQRAYARVADMLDVKAGAIPATNYKTGQQWDEPNVWPPLVHVLMEGLTRTPATFGTSDPAYVAVQDLALRLGQRYLDSTFCTWYATGGATSLTPRLQGLEPEENGVMFEKYSDSATNRAGAGGEYEVVEGFGWTNGVLLWVADTFGARLQRPDCGNVTAASAAHSAARKRDGRSALELHPADAAWVKPFGRRAVRRGLEAAAAAAAAAAV